MTSLSFGDIFHSATSLGDISRRHTSYEPLTLTWLGAPLTRLLSATSLGDTTSPGDVSSLSHILLSL